MLATKSIFKNELQVHMLSLKQKQVCWLKGVFALPVSNLWAKASQRFQFRGLTWLLSCALLTSSVELLVHGPHLEFAAILPFRFAFLHPTENYIRSNSS